MQSAVLSHQPAKPGVLCAQEKIRVKIKKEKKEEKTYVILELEPSQQ